jgi:hypothetical protein
MAGATTRRPSLSSGSHTPYCLTFYLPIGKFTLELARWMISVLAGDGKGCARPFVFRISVQVIRVVTEVPLFSYFQTGSAIHPIRIRGRQISTTNDFPQEQVYET